MAIPRGFKRGSGGFLQPIGSVPSGASSGPGRFALADRGHRREGMKKVLASFGKAQKVHEGVMAKIATAETAAVERITKAYNESKKNDPKDELGRTVPSAVTSHLGKQLIGLMGMASQRQRQTATPQAAGITPQQLEEGRSIGFGGPGGSPLDTPRDDSLMDTTGVTGLGGPQGAQLQPGVRQIVQPVKGAKAIHTSGAEVELTGEQREGPQGTELEALVNGKKGWVKQDQLSPGPEQQGETGAQALLKFLGPQPERDFQPF